jgi:hypothetical protein
MSVWTKTLSFTLSLSLFSCPCDLLAISLRYCQLIFEYFVHNNTQKALFFCLPQCIDPHLTFAWISSCYQAFMSRKLFQKLLNLLHDAWSPRCLIIGCWYECSPKMPFFQKKGFRISFLSPSWGDFFRSLFAHWKQNCFYFPCTCHCAHFILWRRAKFNAIHHRWELNGLLKGVHKDICRY